MTDGEFKVLFEPIIKKRKINRLFFRNKLVTGHSFLNNVKIKVTHLSGRRPSEFQLKKVKLIDGEGKGYESTYKPITIKKLDKRKEVESKEIKMLFPFPGLYYLEVQVTLNLLNGDRCRVETFQITLEGDQGRGWSDQHDSTAFCRMPILVLDYHTVILKWITYMLLFLTIILSIPVIQSFVKRIINFF